MKHAVALAIALTLPATAAYGRDIDLVTLPPRTAVQLTIYNSEDLTLVKEIRSITFKRGVNRLQFSWANTLIDPTSVYLRPLEQEDQIEVLDTTFPGDRPQVLIWNVESAFEGQARVEVSYFTSGISWSADYVMITDAGETQAAFDGYVTVVNNSGEDYEGAQVRLVVGVINLVEKIAQLAQQGMPVTEEKAKETRLRAFRGAMDKAEQAPSEADGKPATKAPEIIKEGLSEYFIFTVEGAQTVKSGWSQRMVSFRARQVPFRILYRFRAHQYGPRPVRFFILANDTEQSFATTGATASTSSPPRRPSTSPSRKRSNSTSAPTTNSSTSAWCWTSRATSSSTTTRPPSSSAGTRPASGRKRSATTGRSPSRSRSATSSPATSSSRPRPSATSTSTTTAPPSTP
ncbi:MAG: hypothetical protein AMS14_04170 [Planctomycetes bacterium DG_20]|nr:MAG: hypothetical protein AMS14_04170 [Planctomycetes bacterium DG_20]